MGYSCTNAALKTFEKVMAAAKKNDGIEQTNTWMSRGQKYFCESPEETPDGSGGYFAQVMRMVGNGAVDCGYIEIKPDGSVYSWPGLLNSFVKNALKS